MTMLSTSTAIETVSPEAADPGTGDHLTEVTTRFTRVGAEQQKSARQAWSTRTFGWELWRAAVAAGLLELGQGPVPQALGELGAALEGLATGSGDPGFSIVPITHCALGMAVIREQGTPALRERWLPRLATGEQILAFAITETSGGTDALRPSTTLTRDGDGFRLDGAKWHITSAPVADAAIVWASDPEMSDIVGVLVETGWEGVKSSSALSPAGTRSAPVGSFKLENVRVPEDHLLARGRGRAVLNAALVRERILAGAVCIGIMERALDHGLSFALTREVAGVTIGTHQHIQRRLCDIKLRLDTTRGLFDGAVARAGRGEPHTLEASQVKMYAVRAAMDSIVDTIQICGSYGVQEQAGLYQMLLDCLCSTIAGGTEEAHRMVIMRELLRRQTRAASRSRGVEGAPGAPGTNGRRMRRPRRTTGAASNGAAAPAPSAPSGASGASGASLEAERAAAVEAMADRLAGFPAFVGCPADQLSGLAARCGELSVPENWAFILEGMPGDTCYILLEGQLRVTQAGVEISRVEPGQIVGEVALVEQRPRTATVVTETPVRLLSLDAAEFNGWLNEQPGLRERLMSARARGGDYVF
ncbi:MAG TPA: acyl-CoA dehydrogenase family protein [Pseudonocardia sp.]|nr:acyl-CoA dehydrogenase family protein [Pseudonocardia sp.]